MAFYETVYDWQGDVVMNDVLEEENGDPMDLDIPEHWDPMDLDDDMDVGRLCLDIASMSLLDGEGSDEFFD